MQFNDFDLILFVDESSYRNSKGVETFVLGGFVTTPNNYKSIVAKGEKLRSLIGEDKEFKGVALGFKSKQVLKDCLIGTDRNRQGCSVSIADRQLEPYLYLSHLISSCLSEVLINADKPDLRRMLATKLMVHLPIGLARQIFTDVHTWKARQVMGAMRSLSLTIWWVWTI